MSNNAHPMKIHFLIIQQSFMVAERCTHGPKKRPLGDTRWSFKNIMKTHVPKRRNIFTNLKKHAQGLLKVLHESNAARSSKHNRNGDTKNWRTQLGPERLLMFGDYKVSPLSLLLETHLKCNFLRLILTMWSHDSFWYYGRSAVSYRANVANLVISQKHLQLWNNVNKHNKCPLVSVVLWVWVRKQ